MVRSGRAAGPCRGPGRSGGEPGLRAGGDPSRPDAGLAVLVLPRRGGRDGVGPRAAADHGHPRAGLRRCAPVELRHVRLARPSPRVRRQRLRRDLAGLVRMGRQAARGERRGRGARSRIQRRGGSRRGACVHVELSHPHGAIRGHAVHRHLVLADRRGRRERALRRRPVAGRGAPAPPGDRQGAPAHERGRAREALRQRRRRVPDSLGAAADRPRPARALRPRA